MITKISTAEFSVMSRYILGICGISLDPSKAYLIETRLGELLSSYNCASFSELHYKATTDPNKTIQRKIIDAITTNETSFFRDTSPFELLQHKLIPDLIDRKSKMPPLNIRIWCAACSTGQEVYSTAITLKELLVDTSNYNIKIHGTDISDNALSQASRGIYNRIEMERGLPSAKMEKYFTADGSSWKIRDEIRAMTTFSNVNLMNDISSLGHFDIIMCRNVAIYFTEQDKTTLFNRISRLLDANGALIIGSTESISGICPQFESKRYLRSVFYQLRFN